MSEAYKKAGVDIAAGNEAVERMKKHVQRTLRPEVLTELGGFGAAFALNKQQYEDPVLVSGTDGVGTKLKLAFALDRHDTIGIDAVAMCVNDIVVQGAEPLFFLDYLAVDRVIPEKIEAIVKGIAAGCMQAGCALIGGETAEMPDMYADGEYDIAGFAVGIVDRAKLIDGSNIAAGDVILGLPSSGVHSNGFSLVRKLLLEEKGYDLHAPIETLEGTSGRTLGELLLTPTKIYVQPILALLKEVEVKGLSHITGGGLLENIPRILPKHLRAEIEYGSWPVPPIFALLREEGELSYPDCFRTFNMGIGMAIIVSAADVDKVQQLIAAQGEDVYRIGRIVTVDDGSAGASGAVAGDADGAGSGDVLAEGAQIQIIDQRIDYSGIEV